MMKLETNPDRKETFLNNIKDRYLSAINEDETIPTNKFVIKPVHAIEEQGGQPLLQINKKIMNRNSLPIAMKN